MIRWIWEKMLKWGWDFNRGLRSHEVCAGSDRVESSSNVRIGIIQAMNGKVLEISKRNTTNHIGPEWSNTLFLVPEDMTLTDAVTTLLIAEGLNK